MNRKVLALSASLVLAGCTASAPERPVTTVSRPTIDTRGLERVMGHTAAQLTQLFGEPGLDVREDSGRKLQFASAACVLDAYLYPQRSGQEPVVTHVDARNRAGEDVDRAACVEALARR